MAAGKKVQPIDLNDFPIYLDNINDRKLVIKGLVFPQPKQLKDYKNTISN